MSTEPSIHPFNEVELESEILEKSLDAIWVVDEDHTIEYCNPAAARLVGFEKSDLEKKNFSTVLPEEVAMTHHAFVADFSRKPIGSPSSVLGTLRELEIKHKLGERIPIELVAFEILPENGKRRFAGIMRDLRERRNHEKNMSMLISTLQKLAYIDELTMLPNRRSFFEQYQKVTSLAARKGRSSVLAILDLDRFKLINDNYGHLVGDKVLKGVSLVLQKKLRIEDVVGRIGGEEFACLLPETDLNGAKIVLERIRQAIEGETFLVGDGQTIHVSTSIGFVKIENKTSPEEAFKMADMALYQAKNSGRNKTVCFNEKS